MSKIVVVYSNNIFLAIPLLKSKLGPYYVEKNYVYSSLIICEVINIYTYIEQNDTRISIISVNF